MNKAEQLKFDRDGVGSCRHCGRVIAKKDKRNLRIGFPDGKENFLTAGIIVNKTAFRCPACFTRHQFEPFQPDQIIST